MVVEDRMTALNRRNLLAGSVITLSAPAFGRNSPEPEKRYHSDYFSFIGSDAQGTVYLAHDNNRGQTGDRFFADHWIMMWADGQGVVPIVGSQHYPNPGKLLEYIPDSENFQFRGSIADGMRMMSASNEIDMTVEGLKPILRRQQLDDDYWIGAAAATMKWKGRMLRGRVIFESIARKGYNRFTSDFGANWNNFNGLYLLTEEGGDVYLRYHEKVTPGVPRESGMATLERDGVLTDIDFRITESRAHENRAYRWPTKWSVDFTHNNARWQLAGETKALEIVADWDRGGFAMSVINGQIAKADGSARRNFKGWAELLI
jgi:hypothetical protein